MKSTALAIGAALVAIAAGSPAAAEAGTITKLPHSDGTFRLVFAASPGEDNELLAGRVDATMRFQDSVPITTFPAGCCFGRATGTTPCTSTAMCPRR